MPEVLAVLGRRLTAPLRVWRRRSWFYRWLLRGSLADRLSFQPNDYLPRRLEDADALLRGRFRLAGEMLEVTSGSVFEQPPPSRAWLEALHGFEWLPPLSAADGEAARTLAANLIAQWLKRYAKYSEPAWLPGVMARRLLNFFCQGRLVLTRSDVLWRSRLFVCLREQSRMLARIADEAPKGLPRLECAAALVLSAACLDRNAQRFGLGLKLLEQECARQILPDGGHITRQPESLLHAYRLLTMAMDAAAALGREVPRDIRAAHDRMAPMLRFFRHGDRQLALFNGGHEGHARSIELLLARDEVRGQPFGHARHSGFHRIALSRTIVVMDCGGSPPLAYAQRAHAGCLAFEVSAGGQRIIVNCGAGVPGASKWDDALAATAAHSTVTLADRSSGALLAPGWVRALVGSRLLSGPSTIETNRIEEPAGWKIEAAHDGYESMLGVRHERQVTLSQEGLLLAGIDRLVPVATANREAIPFAIRFHIHPDVRASPAQSGDVLLKLPNGEGWRFRCSDQTAVTEESVYLGGETVRRTEQLVLTGSVKGSPVEVAWSLEQI